MKMTKIAALMVCTVLLTVTAVLGTLAYLTDSEEVKNTFTVGNVSITVNETDVDKDGVPVLDDQGNPVERVKENEYHLLPGKSYFKDPTMTVDAGSEESFVRMILTVTNASKVQNIITKYGLTDYSDLFSGWKTDKWLYVGFDVENDEIAFEFRYHTTVSGTVVDGSGNETEEDVTLEPLFTSIVVPGEVNNEELADLKDVELRVTGHAIQKSGFEADTENNLSAEDVAWAAFDTQTSGN